MNEKEELCAIPRNLNKDDIVIHTPIKMNWRQIFYLGVGSGMSYLAFGMDVSHVTKAVLISGSFISSAVAGFIKYEDSHLDEVAIDGLHHLQKKNIYKQLEKRGDQFVNVKVQEEQRGKTKGFRTIHPTVSTSKTF